MPLYDGLVAWLVGENLPLQALRWERLPEEQIDQVDVAVFATPGAGAETVLGQQALRDPVDGVTHDGGVDDVHTGLTFEARTAPGDETLGRQTLLKVMGRMLLIDPPDMRPAGSGFLLCELTNGPFVIEQDRRERLISQLALELWLDPYEGRRV